MPFLLRQKEVEPGIENWLASSKPEHHALAEETLERLGEERAAELLLAAAERERPKWRNRIAVAVCSFALLILINSLLDLAGADSGIRLPLLLMAYLLIPIAYVWTRRSPFMSIARSLAFYEDIRSVGYLTEALHHSGDRRTRALIAPHLTRLLYQVTSSERSLLDPWQQIALREIAASRRRARQMPELVCAAFSAIAEIGDRASYEAARKVAKRRANTPEARRVRQAAQECLETMDTWMFPYKGDKRA